MSDELNFPSLETPRRMALLLSGRLPNPIILVAAAHFLNEVKSQMVAALAPLRLAVILATAALAPGLVAGCPAISGGDLRCGQPAILASAAFGWPLKNGEPAPAFRAAALVAAVSALLLASYFAQKVLQ